MSKIFAFINVFNLSHSGEPIFVTNNHKIITVHCQWQIYQTLLIRSISLKIAKYFFLLKCQSNTLQAKCNNSLTFENLWLAPFPQFVYSSATFLCERRKKWIYADSAKWLYKQLLKKCYYLWNNTPCNQFDSELRRVAYTEFFWKHSEIILSKIQSDWMQKILKTSS